MKYTDFQGIPNPEAAHQGPLTVGATATALTSLMTLHNRTEMVAITIEDAAIRITVNGTTPTATLGFNHLAGTRLELSRAEAQVAKVIRATGTDAKLQTAQYTL